MWQEFLAKAKISEYDMTIGVEEDILKLDVPVDDAQL
jgi:hypothetical protein